MFFSMSDCLFLHLSAYPSVYLSIHLSLCYIFCMFVCLYVDHLSVCMTVCLSTGINVYPIIQSFVCMSIFCQYVHLYMSPCVHLSFCLSVLLSICLSIQVYICRYAYLTIVYLFVFVNQWFICLFVSLLICL